MARRRSRDFAHFDDDDTVDEDATLFFPMPNNGPDDGWSAFWGGILIGLAGAGLVTLLPWLAGTLIFGGYAMTAYSLWGSRNGFARALGFGYGLLSGVGAAMVLGEIFFPYVTAWLIAAAAERHIVFLSFAVSAWPIALVKYVFGRLSRRNARSAASGRNFGRVPGRERA